MGRTNNSRFTNSELQESQKHYQGDLRQAGRFRLWGVSGEGGEGAGLVSINSAGQRRRWRVLLYDLALAAVGLILAFTPWLPGLGAILLGVALFMAPIFLLQAWLGL